MLIPKMPIAYLPNLITMSRLLLAAPIVWSLLTNYRLTALSLLILAGLTDWLDGWLARRYKGWQSELGAFLDPMADKVLLMSTFLTLYYLQWISKEVCVIVVGRDVGILLGIFVYRLWIGPLHYRPIFISKLNTVLQIVLVVSLLIHRDLLTLPDTLLTLINLSMVSTSILSFVGYARLWIMKVREQYVAYTH